MPFAKRGDVVHSEATSGFNNQKKSLLINGLAALGDSLHPLHCFKGFSTSETLAHRHGGQVKHSNTPGFVPRTVFLD